MVADSRVIDLVASYPFLQDFMLTYHPAVSRLGRPLMRNTLDRRATLTDAAHLAGIPVDRLVAEVRSEVAAHTTAGPDSD